jgi:hypothetical protein
VDEDQDSEPAAASSVPTPPSPPAVLPLGAEAVIFAVTDAARRRQRLRVIGSGIGWLLLFLTIVVLSNGGDLTTVPILFFGLALFGSGSMLYNGWTKPGPISLRLSPHAVIYEDSGFRIQSAWDNVEGIVRLGTDPQALALNLRTGAVVTEDPGRNRSWRRRPYRFDRTVPLEPFLLGDPEERVLRAIGALTPGVVGWNPEIVEPAHADAATRILGWAIVVVPFLILLGAIFVVPGQRSWTGSLVAAVAFQMVLVGGFLTVSLWRWNETTAERVMDWIGRVVRAPGPDERRADVAGVVLRRWAAFGFYLLLGTSIWLTGGQTSTVDLAARYGPAHQCWQDSDNKIAGCRMVNGTVRGSAGGTPVTCFFTEPLTAATVTFHCRP